MWNLNTRILQSPFGKLGNVMEKDSMRVLKQLSILLVWTKPCWDFYVPQLFNLSTAGALWKQLCGDDASWVLTFMLTFTPTLCFELWNLSWLSALDIMDTWRHNHVEETTCCTSLVSFMSLCQHTKITETFRRWRSRSVEFRMSWRKWSLSIEEHLLGWWRTTRRWLLACCGLSGIRRQVLLIRHRKKDAVSAKQSFKQTD